MIVENEPKMRKIYACVVEEYEMIVLKSEMKKLNFGVIRCIEDKT